jgi:uncharacterized repeat protein (TIGR01451 family)
MPAGERMEHYTLKDEALTYTVRFENEGNSEAIDITVKDSIDKALDISTLNVVNSSFPVFTMINNNAVIFFFKNIWLPAKGKGFVTYEIMPLAGTPDLTIVKNKADILFDFNQPVITNTTENTLVESLCQDVHVILDTSVCAGQQFMGWTESGTYMNTVPVGSYCDSVTTILLEVLAAEVISLDTFICEGSDFLGLSDPGLFNYDTIHPVTGCHQVLEISLQVIPIGDPGCLTVTHTPESHELSVYPNPAKREIHVSAKSTIHAINFISSEGIVHKPDRVTYHNEEAYIDLEEHMPAGLYKMMVALEDKVVYVGIVIQP